MVMILDTDSDSKNLHFRYGCPPDTFHISGRQHHDRTYSWQYDRIELPWQ